MARPLLIARQAAWLVVNVLGGLIRATGLENRVRSAHAV
jgi:hypothetical protein